MRHAMRDTVFSVPRTILPALIVAVTVLAGSASAHAQSGLFGNLFGGSDRFGGEDRSS